MRFRYAIIFFDLCEVVFMRMLILGAVFFGFFEVWRFVWVL